MHFHNEVVLSSDGFLLGDGFPEILQVEARLSVPKFLQRFLFHVSEVRQFNPWTPRHWAPTTSRLEDY